MAAARKTRKARNLGTQPLMNGRRAMTGARAIRESVRMLGRVHIMAPRSPEGLQYQLRDRLERFEYSLAGNRDGLEIGRAPNPVPILLGHQKLSRVPRVRQRFLLRRV